MSASHSPQLSFPLAAASLVSGVAVAGASWLLLGQNWADLEDMWRAMLACLIAFWSLPVLPVLVYFCRTDSEPDALGDAADQIAANTLVKARLVQMITRINSLPDTPDRSEVHTALSRLPRLDDLPLQAFAALPDLADRMMALEDLRHEAGIANDPRRPQALAALHAALGEQLETVAAESNPATAAETDV